MAKTPWNIPYNGLCTLYDENTAKLIAKPGIERWVLDLMLEVQEAARACGVCIEDAFIQKMLSNTRRMVDYEPSMLLDLRNGRALELEYMYWKPINFAKKNGYNMVLAKNLVRQLSLIDPAGYQPEAFISLVSDVEPS